MISTAIVSAVSIGVTFVPKVTECREAGGLLFVDLFEEGFLDRFAPAFQPFFVYVQGLMNEVLFRSDYIYQVPECRGCVVRLVYVYVEAGRVVYLCSSFAEDSYDLLQLIDFAIFEHRRYQLAFAIVWAAYGSVA